MTDVFIITFVPYFIMIICNIKIMRHLNHYQHCLSSASRKVQRDLNRVLLAHAIIPIFSAFLPMAIYIFSSITAFDFTFVTFICGIFYSWIPIGNAITIFIFVTAYREKLMQLILRLKPQLHLFTSNLGTITTS